MTPEHADPVPPHEQAADELHGSDAFAALEAGLRRLQPVFQEHRRLCGLDVIALPRGVAIECRFADDAPHVRVVVSRAWARVLHAG